MQSYPNLKLLKRSLQNEIHNIVHNNLYLYLIQCKNFHLSYEFKIDLMKHSHLVYPVEKKVIEMSMHFREN